jgi:hypothetical protein
MNKIKLTYIVHIFLSFRKDMSHTPVGRRPNIIIFIEVNHMDKEYIVGFLTANGEEIAFVFDKEEYEKINSRNWHRTAEMYIASTTRLEGKQKQLYMHNLVMGRMGYNGKGQTETVDHINRNGFDNRKANLRIATQSAQNINQRQRSRAVVLPEECGIAAEEIPRHIWYIHKNGSHGDRFAIEFKSENLVWKSTSSKLVSTRDKLNEAIAKLNELYLEYPHLNPNNAEKTQEIESLQTSFEEIVALARSKKPQT